MNIYLNTPVVVSFRRALSSSWSKRTWSTQRCMAPTMSTSNSHRSFYISKSSSTAGINTHPEPTPPPAPAPTAKDNLVSPVHDFHNLGQTPTTSLPGTTDSYLLAKFGAAVDRATVVAAQLAHEKQRHGSDAARETAHRCLASLSSTDPAPPPPPPTKWGTTFDDFHNAVIQTAAFRTAHFRGA